MSIYNFVSQEILDGLPVEEPTRAFSQFIRVAQPRFNEILRAYDEQTSDIALRYDFQTAVMTVANSFGITELSFMEMPDHDNYGYNDFRSFEVALNRVVARLGIGKARRQAENTVFLPRRTKATIEKQLKSLRTSVETLPMEPQMRIRLLRQLDEVEKALQLQRFQMIHVALLILTLATIPGGLGETMKVIEAIAVEVQKAVAEEQEHNQALALGESQPPLLPDDKNVWPTSPAPPRFPSATSAPAFESDGTTDDDIPF